VATDDVGNGFAVWERSDDGGLTANIWSNLYDVEQQAWGTAELLQSSGEATRARLPLVAADPPGNAIALWVQVDMVTGDEVMWARRYDEESSTWSAAGPIGEAEPTSLVRATGLGIDGDGNAIAVWSRPTVMGDVVWANRYTADVGWGTAELIKKDADNTARGLRISVGSGGDAFVIWTQGDEARADVWAVRFSDSDSDWEDPERIDRYDAGDKTGPDIAVDGDGFAHAVWSQVDPDFDNNDIWNIWANQYTPGSEWGAPQLIEPPNEDPEEDGPASSPRVGVNSAGNAFVVWLQIWNDWSSVWSNRLDRETGWMTAERIEDIGRPAKAPTIAVDEDRHAHALWPHWVDTGFDWIRTNRFE
jgi:hypothetical protein